MLLYLALIFLVTSSTLAQTTSNRHTTTTSTPEETTTMTTTMTTTISTTLMEGIMSITNRKKFHISPLLHSVFWETEINFGSEGKYMRTLFTPPFVFHTRYCEGICFRESLYKSLY